jgi:hypothetical protein
LLATGCAVVETYRPVEPGVRSIGGVYTVEPGLAWSSSTTGKLEMWTIDGVALENLRFFTGIADGEPLPVSRAVVIDDRRPRFRSWMTAAETSDFVAESLYGTQFTPKNVRPAPFGRASGFRFELSYTARDGVQRDALVAAAVVQQRLHLIAYEGTALYHFARYRGEVERIIGSVRLK